MPISTRENLLLSTLCSFVHMEVDGYAVKARWADPAHMYESLAVVGEGGFGKVLTSSLCSLPLLTIAPVAKVCLVKRRADGRTFVMKTSNVRIGSPPADMVHKHEP